MTDHSLRYAVRTLLRDKGFSATVVLTLAVCIAANTTTFAVVNSVLLRPLPVADSQDIVSMSNQYPKAGVGESSQSAPGDYYDRLAGAPALEQQALFRMTTQTLSVPGADINGRAEQIRGEIGQEQKIILSDPLWRRLYNADPKALGRQVRLNGKLYDIVGVMPAGFNFYDPEVRFWIPAAFNAEDKVVHHSNGWNDIGRLRAGASIAQVQAQVNAINAANLDRFPAYRDAVIASGFYTSVEPLQHLMVKKVEGSLYLLWGASAFVLLLGVLNIVNLVLAQLTVRRKEVAIRLALGVSRTRLARQMLVESTLLSGVGCVAGVLLGFGSLRLLAVYGLDQFPRAGEVHLDMRVVLVAAALGLAVGIVTGLMPLANVFQTNLGGALKDSSRTGTSGVGTRELRRALVVAEIAFAFVLITGAGLLLASFRNLLRVDPGFTTSNVLTASISLPRAKYKSDADLVTLMGRVVDSLSHLPGVSAAGSANTIPLGGDYNDSVILAEGYHMKPGESVISPHNMVVTNGYFDAMKIGLRWGRVFDERDVAGAMRVIVIDETLARHFWQDRNPAGKRMYVPSGPEELSGTGPNTRWLTVIGVVHAIRMEDLAGTGNSSGEYYFPYAQNPTPRTTFAIKTNVPANTLLSAVRAAIARVDPEIPVFDAKTMEDREELSMASRRMSMTLALAFGALALFLSAIGIYGVLAYLVTQRRREIGIRVALGSTGGGIVALVLRECFTLVTGGLVLGTVGVVSLQKAIANEVYGVKPLDPPVMCAGVAILAGIALVACAVPARRAAHVNPVTVLGE